MNRTYDERELLPKAIPSSHHPSRTICSDISTADSNAGTELSRAMSAIYGDAPLADDKITVHFRGSAGSGFGSGLGSGITFVADAIGENGCKGMTGGRAVLLSMPGKGFCSGLKGGHVYVFADGVELPALPETLVVGEPDESERLEIRSLVEEHSLLTKSAASKSILINWAKSSLGFIRISAAA